MILQNLGYLFRQQGRYQEAERHYQQALPIFEQALGPDHPDMATLLTNLGRLYHLMQQDGLAEPLLLRGVAIRERVLGPEHADTRTSLNALAELFKGTSETDVEMKHPYAIYHATDVMAMAFPSAQDWQDREKKYRHVANVYAPRARIFALTNHTNGQDWTKHPEVFWVSPDVSPRSTCVGDVIYSPSMGRVWLVQYHDLQEITQM